DPIPVPDPVHRAARMAIAMRDRVEELQTRWRKLGYELTLAIGMAEGDATLGGIGFEGRWDYAAVGTVANLAVRLCSEAKGGQILVSSKVAATLEPIAELADVGALTLKGLARPVPVLSLLRLRS